MGSNGTSIVALVLLIIAVEPLSSLSILLLSISTLLLGGPEPENNVYLISLFFALADV